MDSPLAPYKLNRPYEYLKLR